MAMILCPTRPSLRVHGAQPEGLNAPTKAQDSAIEEATSACCVQAAVVRPDPRVAAALRRLWPIATARAIAVSFDHREVKGAVEHE